MPVSCTARDSLMVASSGQPRNWSELSLRQKTFIISFTLGLSVVAVWGVWFSLDRFIQDSGEATVEANPGIESKALEQLTKAVSKELGRTNLNRNGPAPKKPRPGSGNWRQSWSSAGRPNHSRPRPPKKMWCCREGRHPESKSNNVSKPFGATTGFIGRRPRLEQLDPAQPVNEDSPCRN